MHRCKIMLEFIKDLEFEGDFISFMLEDVEEDLPQNEIINLTEYLVKFITKLDIDNKISEDCMKALALSLLYDNLSYFKAYDLIMQNKVEVLNMQEYYDKEVAELYNYCKTHVTSKLSEKDKKFFDIDSWVDNARQYGTSEYVYLNYTAVFVGDSEFQVGQLKL